MTARQEIRSSKSEARRKPEGGSAEAASGGRPRRGAWRWLWAALGCWVVAGAVAATSGRQPLPQADTGPADLTLLQCANWIYAGNRSSVCFADRFLSLLARETTLQVNPRFRAVRLDADAVFDYPFSVMSGNEDFRLTPKERQHLRQYLLQGGFLLASPGCSDEVWDRAFRREIQLCFPDYSLNKIPMDHPIFSTVHSIPRLTDRRGRAVLLEAMDINGRVALVYSKEGLNDVAHAKGCCCCGGNEIRNPEQVNVNVFTYALLY